MPGQHNRRPHKLHIRLRQGGRRLVLERLESREMLAAFDVLVFSKTAGFRHGSIEAGIAAIQALGAAHDFGVVATEDSNGFTPANLANFEAVIFLNTTGDVLNAVQQAAFEQYIQAGGGWVGIHSAADTEYSWTWYGDLLGAYFESHPAIQQATIVVEDDSHPSTAHLPDEWIRTDEWYNFQTNPRGQVNVLLTLDESTYSGGADGPDHPIAWYHQYDGGRAWYTGMGHTDASYSEPLFREHLLGGILYAAGQLPPQPSADFNEDGDVDGDDFLQWQRGLGISSGAARADGDANADGRVDADDLAVWTVEFGNGGASAAANRSAAIDQALAVVDGGDLHGSLIAPLAPRGEWAGLSPSRFVGESTAVARASFDFNSFELNHRQVEEPLHRRPLAQRFSPSVEFPGEGHVQRRRALRPHESSGAVPQELADGLDTLDQAFTRRL